MFRDERRSFHFWVNYPFNAILVDSKTEEKSLKFFLSCQFHTFCIYSPSQKNPLCRPGTLWTAHRHRRKRQDHFGSLWHCKNRRASENSSRTESIRGAIEKLSWLRNRLRTEIVYVYIINITTQSIIIN